MGMCMCDSYRNKRVSACAYASVTVVAISSKVNVYKLMCRMKARLTVISQTYMITPRSH